MKTRIRVVRASALSELEAMRHEYLDVLGEAQEPSLEMLVHDADCYWIEQSGVRFGYAIVHDTDTLIEFYLERPYWVFGECIFEQLLEQLALRRAWIKSFDHLLFSSAVARHKTLRVKGLLVRDLILRDLPRNTALECASRPATIADMPAILNVDQPVFRQPERLAGVVEAGQLELFERANQLVGFGITRPVAAGRKHVELGIAVDKPYRLRGYAIYIFRALVERALAQGLIPIAGVAVENAASRSMGERVGMVARHRLLELTF